ncbi:hypothetical protein SOVF_022710 [Spinacia oleracea]|nr:hypothetical protein SOVF_022710 [Spinacia oleracea]
MAATSAAAQINILGNNTNKNNNSFLGQKLRNSNNSNNSNRFSVSVNSNRRNDRQSRRFGSLRVVCEKVVGIDLGTTNSAVAAMEGGQPTIITNVEGQRTTPSVVAYTKGGDRLVGQIAKRQAVVNPENTFFSVKRFVGRKMGEVDEESKQVSYKVVKDDIGNVKLECPAIGKLFAPEEISAQSSASRLLLTLLLLPFAVLEVGDGVFEVLSTSGDTHLGGDDFDKRIVDWLAETFRNDEGIDLRNDRQALQRLTEAAEKAKIELSTLTQTTIRQAGVLAGDVSDIVLLDVTPLSLGLETLGGVMTKIIPRNTTLPTSKSEVFSTAADGQTSVEINVLQGEREFVRDNKSLGSFRLDGIPPSPRGVPQIEVKFDIDANGILSVTAVDKGTGKKQDITITGASTLPKDEVEKMVQEADRFAKEDKEKREAIDTKNQADAVVYQTEKQLKELGEKIPAEVKEKVEAKLKDLKDVMEGGITQKIKDAIAAVNQEAMQIGQSLYSQPGAAEAGPTAGTAAGPAEPTGTSSGDNGDVIDADFTESK